MITTVRVIVPLDVVNVHVSVGRVILPVTAVLLPSCMDTVSVAELRDTETLVTVAVLIAPNVPTRR